MLSITSLLKTKTSPKIGSLVFKLSLVLVAIFTSSFNTPNTNSQANNINECENGLSAALGYNAFVQYGVSVGSGDTEGPIAMGGDLTLDGTFTVAAHTGGSYYHNGENQAASLVVNGKIIYKSNQGINLNQGFVKIGDLSGSNVYDKDNNNVTTNTRITPGGYDQSPRIHLQRNQAFSSVNAGNIIDFNAAFAKLNAASAAYSQLANNIVIENGNKITLANNTTNVLHLSGNELNNLTNFTFNNQPTADSPLIINVNYSGDFYWNVQNQAGIGDHQGAFIIYNFYNSSKVIINGGGTIMGTVLAPSSDVEKRTSGNINGQVIAKSYIHLSGELHQHTYNHCEEKVCELAVDAGDKQVVCEGTNVTLTATASGSSCEENITYSWSGPGIVGSSNESSITVDTSGTYTVQVEDCDTCLAEDTVVVKINKNPEVTVTSENTNCYANEGTITFSFDNYQYRSHIKLSIDGGNSFVKVKDNIGSYTFTGLEANTYDIAVKWGNNQCPLNLDAVVIEELQAMTVDAGEEKEICLGETVTLTAQIDTLSEGECSTEATYLWSTGETTQSINVSPTENTEYTVSTSNCGNCTAEDSVLITVKETPEAEVTSENGTCAANTDGSITFYFDAEADAATIDVSIDGGNTYTTANTGAGSYTFENLAAGSYDTSIRSSDEGCTVSLDEVVIEEIPTITLDVGPDIEICKGKTTTLTAQIEESDIPIDLSCIQYLWSTGETTQSIHACPNTTAEYTVTITGCDDYCVIEDTVTVTVMPNPEATVAVTSGTCENTTNGEITFYFEENETFETIDLSINAGKDFITVDYSLGSYTFENLAVGDYFTAIKASANGCILYLGDVTIEETPSIILDAGPDLEICKGKTTTLTAQIEESDIPIDLSCVQYLWSTGETTQSIHACPNTTAEYTVTINGCDDYCVVEDTVTVTVMPNPVATVAATSGTCENTTNGEITFYFEENETFETIDLSINAGKDFITVDYSLGSYTFENLAVGDYFTAIKASANGCILYLGDVTIEEIPSIVLDAGDDITIDFGETGTLSVTPYLPGVDYLWSTGEIGETISVDPTETTTYTVTATSSEGCYTEDSVTVEVIVDPCLSQEYNVVAYPVPVDAQGVLNIDIAVDEDQMVNYTTYRMNGTRIGPSVDVDLPKGCNTINVDLVKHCFFIANTQYILIVTGEGWSKTIDFVTTP